jgi:sugar lactone lactonase YvrE
MMRVLGAEPWQTAEAVLGEGPSWDATTGQLSWVDIPSAAVHVSDAGGRAVADFELRAPVSAALPAAGGGWLVALPDRLARLGVNGNLSDVAPLEPDLPGNRTNDAKCDPAGRAWVGTMDAGEKLATGSLYRLGPGPWVSRVLTGLGIANGMGWSPDNRTMYFIDTVTHRIDAHPFDLASGSIGEPRAVVHIDSADGHPDGMCTDDEGSLWVALFGGGCVRRYAPDGRLDTVVQLPVTYPTSCCFGGPYRDRLFITTACRDLDERGRQDEPLAGSVWVTEPGVTGPAATPWSN